MRLLKALVRWDISRSEWQNKLVVGHFEVIRSLDEGVEE